MRSCVPEWMIDEVCIAVEECGMGAFEVFFGDDLPPPSDDIERRIFAALKYNGNSSDVRAILSM